MTIRYKRASDAEIARQIKSNPDDMELTPELAAKGRPFREVLPELAASIDREIAKRGRPPVDYPKKLVTLRLDHDVLAKFEATGKGWRTRINDALRDAKV